MNELHASETVAAKITEQRQKLGWSMRELAERSGLSEDRIEAIENNRRRRGVTVDELMVLAHALNDVGAGVITVAFTLLPSDSDYWSDEQRARADAAQREHKAKWEADAPRRKASLDAMAELPAFLHKLGEFFGKIPDGAVIAVEQEGKLVAVEETAGFLDRDFTLSGADVPLDHADVGPAAEAHQ